MSSITREDLKNCKRVVVKVGTSTLTYETGRLNLTRVEKLTRIIANIRNSGKDVVLVTSGAVSLGATKLGLKEKPKAIEMRQATAAVGQNVLMNIYARFFSNYNHVTGQILLTKDVVEEDILRQNAKNTFETLFTHGVIPIVNENDSIATEELELEFGDNDTLSGYVASLCGADLLIILSDIDGLYTSDPRNDVENAKLIHQVDKIDEKLEHIAGGAGTSRGTGGMITKLRAAKICKESNIAMVIANGSDPCVIEEILNGSMIGTLFVP